LSDKADLLVEIGCEELPPKSLDQVREALFQSVRDSLEQSQIEFDGKGSQAFSSPRRLALLFRQVAASQPDQSLDRRGPALRAAFDAAGKPTGAALGFARSVGVGVDELETVSSDKGEWLFARVHQPGKPLAELIYPILEKAVKQLPVPKPMRWADHDFSFIRPVHWLVVMHGTAVLPGRLLGQEAGQRTRGHRIHSPGPHVIPTSAEYLQVLEAAFVIADQERRKRRVQEALVTTNPHVHIDPALLAEVNNLVEWPVAVACTFESVFLEVPHAALIASMQDHQKFFPVLDTQDARRISQHFIAISNIESTHTPSVREGYERVIRPRLADARFFLEQDQKSPIEEYLPLLDRVVFQNKIGTVGDKSRRMESISRNLAEFFSDDPSTSSRAARLAKCDLMTQMVGEFPELQGVMGHHYALSSGEPEAVAQAIGEHYAPRFAGDEIPASSAGRLVSLADRADSLVGIFAAGLRPSGNKDPFALRRSALGMVRILLEANLDLPLNKLLAMAANELAPQIEVEAKLLLDVRDFVIERLRHYYRERAYGAELINAVLASDWDTLPDLDSRISALDGFMGLEAAASLAAANKRIGNILRKSEETISKEIDEERLEIKEERCLFDEVKRLSEEVTPLLDRGDYATALSRLATLKEPVDRFFDTVMVMDENAELRANRLALLDRLKSLFDRIADLSVLG
jgi:glycyl-tRNA synthetase beta chain